MKKLRLLFVLLIFYNCLTARVTGLKLLPATNDSIKIEIRSYFSPSPNECDLAGFKISTGSDTLCIIACYILHGIEVELGQGSIDTLFLGYWENRRGINFIQATSYVIDTNGGKADTAIDLPSQSIHRSLNISSIDKQSSIKVFPNPATSRLSIFSEQPIRSAIIQNIQGMILLKKQEAVESIDVAALSPGIYFLKLETNEGVFVKQFLKE